MKKQVLAAGFVLSSFFVLPLKASAANFSQIYAFGDSLVDTGNAYNFIKTTTGVEFPPSPPYFDGHFSNGPIWVEGLSSALGITQTNFAFGGATTGTLNTVNGNLPGLAQQIQGFTTANSQADSKALYVIWAGANDYRAGVINPAEPVNNLINAVKSLASVGAEHFLLVNLPNLGALPGTSNNPTVSAGLTALSTAHNSGLAAGINTLNQQPDIHVTLLDANSLFNKAIASPGEFGYTNVTDACLTITSPTSFTTCPNPNEYLFWDQLHPTTYTHSFLAGAALVAVPESSPALGVLALGALGTVGVLKKRQRTH
ncbi:PEP-CTERM domain protein [Nostoc calcicola FACHB-389]|nr:SGNH/GDSL hydrolase family protein [Nostoc calcicola FACHB-3891]OKH39830.1 PEP-CTERM domain protein [Nostoc calcicola FACHB-389]